MTFLIAFPWVVLIALSAALAILAVKLLRAETVDWIARGELALTNTRLRSPAIVVEYPHTNEPKDASSSDLSKEIGEPPILDLSLEPRPSDQLPGYELSRDTPQHIEAHVKKLRAEVEAKDVQKIPSAEAIQKSRIRAQRAEVTWSNALLVLIGVGMSNFVPAGFHGINLAPAGYSIPKYVGLLITLVGLGLLVYRSKND